MQEGKCVKFSNLPADWSDDDFREIFAHCGTVVSLQRDGGSVAYVLYSGKQDAYASVKELNGAMIGANSCLAEVAKEMPKQVSTSPKKAKAARRTKAQRVPQDIVNPAPRAAGAGRGKAATLAPTAQRFHPYREVRNEASEVLKVTTLEGTRGRSRGGGRGGGGGRGNPTGGRGAGRGGAGAVRPPTTVGRGGGSGGGGSDVAGRGGETKHFNRRGQLLTLKSERAENTNSNSGGGKHNGAGRGGGGKGGLRGGGGSGPSGRGSQVWNFVLELLNTANVRSKEIVTIQPTQLAETPATAATASITGQRQDHQHIPLASDSRIRVFF